MSRIISGLLSLFVVAGLANAAAAADAANGQTLAKRWCAACHVVASDQQRANGQAAPFSAIGKMPDLNAKDLKGAVQTIMGSARSLGIEID